jgi:ABC-type transport system involved in multi-copper enzyme maturation permease subunit
VVISNVSVVKKETFVSGLGRMMGAEFLKLRKRQMTWVLLSILVGIIVLVNLLLLAISKVKTPGTGLGTGNIATLLGLQSAVPFAFSMMASFGTVLAIILTASSMGGEYNWKTIRPALVSSESRFKFIVAKLVSLGILILIGMLIAVIAGFIMGLITTGLGGNAYSFSFLTGSYVWAQFLQYWRTFYVIMPFALLGFMMAIVGRSAMPGIATGIGVVFLEAIITTFMTAAGGWIAKVPAYLLNANVTAITALNKLPGRFGGGGGGTDTTIPSLTHAFVILGLYSVIFLVFSFYLFRKRDVTG